MSEINGTNNNSVKNMLESLNAGYSDNCHKHGHHADSFAPKASKDKTTEILENLARRYATNGASPTSQFETVKPMPATPAPKKKKKKGLFGKIFGGIGKILKAALPIASLVANFIPGVGPLVSLGLKAATAAMGAIDGIKKGNVFGALSSVAGAFTGGATNMLGKMGSVGSYLQKGVDMFKNSGLGSLATKGFDLYNKGKEYLNKLTGGFGDKVSNLINTKGLDVYKNLTRGFGGKFGQLLTSKGPEWMNSLAGRARSWATNKVTNLVNKAIDNPLFQKARNFFESGVGKSLLDLLTKKTA
jgi:hypothetical protein